MKLILNKKKKKIMQWNSKYKRKIGYVKNFFHLFILIFCLECVKLDFSNIIVINMNFDYNILTESKLFYLLNIFLNTYSRVLSPCTKSSFTL